MLNEPAPNGDDMDERVANEHGLTAVVTGGTRGIGAEVARLLAVAGHRVVALARTVPDAAGAAGGVEAMACDVTDADAVAGAIGAIGPVDILVNNAGVSSSNPLGRTTVGEWNRNLAVNATGPFLCTRAVIGTMRERGFGRIVTVASTAALSGDKYIAAYAASKHAVLGLMRVVAAEVDGTGVTANSVCPTFVRTDMTIATIENIADTTGCDLATAEAKLARATPHGRIIEVGEVAAAVITLIDSADNGREVLLDGAPE